MLLKLFVSVLWILSIYLALVIEHLRRTVRKLKRRVDNLECATSDSRDEGWYYDPDYGDDE